MSWIQCKCGQIIHDNTDALSYKGHLISDREFFKLLDFIDSLIESPVSDRELLVIKFRKNIGARQFVDLKTVYQCPVCGRMLIPDADFQFHSFLPEDAESGGLLDFDGTSEPFEPHRRNEKGTV